jgi:hypothetical protein
VPLPRPLFVTGRSADGPVRGKAVAVAVEDPAAPAERTHYLVDDFGRGSAVWVAATDIDRSSPVFPGEPVIGYVTVRRSDSQRAARAPVAAIRQTCDRREWRLVDIVIDTRDGRPVERAGVRRALDCIARGDARALVVADLDGVGRDEDDVAALMTTVRRAGGEVVVSDDEPPTEPSGSRRAAREERAALVERIVEMRLAGMTPRAIADVLNEDGVPPIVGSDGRWHAWSVKELAGAWPPRGPREAAGRRRRSADRGGLVT